MCDTCGCEVHNHHHVEHIDVVQSVLQANDARAEVNRKRLDESGALALNLMSSPGSGKTTLLEKTIPALDRRCAVLVGDLQTSRDAERLEPLAVEVAQINTGKGCHLSASQVEQGIERLRLVDIDYIFIENVGNMVCPATHDLGEHKRVALLSVPEGDDKVLKYPTLFQSVDAVLLTKIDLLSVLDFDVERVKSDLRQLNTRAPLMLLSSKTGEGMERWLDWLRQERAQVVARAR